mmetsp:Transcript_8169/g.25164  ORF Transcript_8169/g.25164 Transcript_8169/m.25164 type:complete len:389 (-) Transcript_8169:1147-2313(-)
MNLLGAHGHRDGVIGARDVDRAVEDGSAVRQPRGVARRGVVAAHAVDSRNHVGAQVEAAQGVVAHVGDPHRLAVRGAAARRPEGGCLGGAVVVRLLGLEVDLGARHKGELARGRVHTLHAVAGLIAQQQPGTVGRHFQTRGLANFHAESVCQGAPRLGGHVVLSDAIVIVVAKVHLCARGVDRDGARRVELRGGAYALRHAGGGVVAVAHAADGRHAAGCDVDLAHAVVLRIRHVQYLTGRVRQLVRREELRRLAAAVGRALLAARYRGDLGGERIVHADLVVLLVGDEDAQAVGRHVQAARVLELCLVSHAVREARLAEHARERLHAVPARVQHPRRAGHKGRHALRWQRVIGDTGVAGGVAPCGRRRCGRGRGRCRHRRRCGVVNG